MHLFLIIALAIPAGLYLMRGIDDTVQGLRELRTSRQYKRYLRRQKVAEEKALLKRQSEHARIWFMMHDSMHAFTNLIFADNELPWRYAVFLITLFLVGCFFS